MEHGSADTFGLVETVDGFHERVVVGVADAPDGRVDSFEGEVLGEPDRGVLGGSVHMGHRVALPVAVP